MKLTRAIALCALTIAIGLTIGAIVPLPSYSVVGARTEPLIIIATSQPTPALPTAAPVPAPLVEQQAAPLVEQQAAPLVEQQAAPLVEQQAAPLVEQQAAPLVEQQAAPDLSMTPGTPEYNEALADIYNTLPVLVFSNDAPASEQPITDRQRQQSRQRTR